MRKIDCPLVNCVGRCRNCDPCIWLTEEKEGMKNEG